MLKLDILDVMRPGNKQNGPPKRTAPTNSGPIDPSRRDTLRIFGKAAIGVTAISAGVGLGMLQEEIEKKFLNSTPERHSLREIEKRRARFKRPQLLSLGSPQPEVQTYDLADDSIDKGTLLSTLRTSPSQLKESKDKLTLSIPYVLEQQCKRKKQITLENKHEVEVSDHEQRVVVALCEEFSTEYNELYRADAIGRSSTSAVEEEFTNMIKEVCGKQMEETVLKKMYQLNDIELKTLKSTLSKISGRELLAYGISEIFFKNWDKIENVRTLNFLLKNAGKEFISRFFSQGDSKNSFGLFQFTDLAFHDPNINSSMELLEKRGASRVNHALKEEFRLPGTLPELITFDEQAKAAFLLAIHNIAIFVNKHLSTKKSSSEAKRARFDELTSAEISQFMGAAHHNPSKAFGAMNSYLHYLVKYEKTINKPQPKRTFKSFCSSEIEEYVEKTDNNLFGLTEYAEEARLNREQ